MAKVTIELRYRNQIIITGFMVLNFLSYDFTFPVPENMT